jgi:hypothetical protein
LVGVRRVVTDYFKRGIKRRDNSVDATGLVVHPIAKAKAIGCATDGVPELQEFGYVFFSAWAYRAVETVKGILPVPIASLRP